MSDLDADVVLAALADILEPMTSHRMAQLSIMRSRVERLRAHVVQYTDKSGTP
jgi:hypothetical protein